MHDGKSMGQGHYTAFVWHSPLQTWLHCNDHRVKVVSWPDVSRQQAYLLLYSAQNSP